MNNFDKIIKRKGTGSIKWDYMSPSKFDGEPIPMWIADMEFEASPAIKEKMKKRIDVGVFGYEARPKAYNEAIVNWFSRRHNFYIKSEWICFSYDVIAAIGTALDSISEEGDSIIVQSPVYHSFYRLLESKNRKIVKNPLINNNGYYTMDYDHLEKCITKNTKAILLCNPHNPVGRVWTREELKKLSDICIKNNIWIISDDIHCEMVFKGHEHTFISTISEETAQKTIICTSPTKAFNLAGIKLANSIIQNEEIRNKFIKITGMPICNSFVAPALIGAYNGSEEWLNESVEYIESNINYFIDYINNNVPKLKVYKPEGTYLVWVNCSELNMNVEELKDFFINNCGVVPNEGIVFGDEGAMYQRLNLACSRQLVEEAAKRIEKAVNKLI